MVARPSLKRGWSRARFPPGARLVLRGRVVVSGCREFFRGSAVDLFHVPMDRGLSLHPGVWFGWFKFASAGRQARAKRQIVVLPATVAAALGSWPLGRAELNFFRLSEKFSLRPGFCFVTHRARDCCFGATGCQFATQHYREWITRLPRWA